MIVKKNELKNGKENDRNKMGENEIKEKNN